MGMGSLLEGGSIKLLVCKSNLYEVTWDIKWVAMAYTDHHATWNTHLYVPYSQILHSRIEIQFWCTSLWRKYECVPNMGMWGLPQRTNLPFICLWATRGERYHLKHPLVQRIFLHSQPFYLQLKAICTRCQDLAPTWHFEQPQPRVSPSIYMMHHREGNCN